MGATNDRNGLEANSTFRPCGAAPRTAVERLDVTELGTIAWDLDAVYRQTTRLFGWVTGATTKSEVDEQSLAQFEAVLGQIAARFGTAEHHFAIDVHTAVMASANRGSKPRGPSTIDRHLARMRRIAAYEVPAFEDRLVNRVEIDLSIGEIDRVAGYYHASVLLVVERCGEVVGGRPILFRKQLLAAVEPRTLAPDLPFQAETALDLLGERGRAFVATRHGSYRLRLIENFWAASR